MVRAPRNGIIIATILYYTVVGKKKGAQRISDDVVEDSTGKSTKTWNKILDKFNLKNKGHTLAAKHLLDKYKLSPWWSQVIVIRYEYERGLKK